MKLNFPLKKTKQKIPDVVYMTCIVYMCKMKLMNCR